jgi:predicted RNA-binding protein with PIN domain
MAATVHTPAVRWIVDGNNVMGARADGWWRDRVAAAGRLVSELDRWQHAGRDPVVVVFDGPAVAELEGRSRDGLTIRCAGSSAPDAADDVIVALVEELFADPALTVVTSDAGLVRRLPPGVGVEGAGRFLRRLPA